MPMQKNLFILAAGLVSLAPAAQAETLMIANVSNEIWTLHTSKVERPLYSRQFRFSEPGEGLFFSLKKYEAQGPARIPLDPGKTITLEYNPGGLTELEGGMQGFTLTDSRGTRLSPLAAGNQMDVKFVVMPNVRRKASARPVAFINFSNPAAARAIGHLEKDRMFFITQDHCPAVLPAAAAQDGKRAPAVAVQSGKSAAAPAKAGALADSKEDGELTIFPPSFERALDADLDAAMAAGDAQAKAAAGLREINESLWQTESETGL